MVSPGLWGQSDRVVPPEARVCQVILGRPGFLVYPASKVTKEIKERMELQARPGQRVQRAMPERTVWLDPQEPRVIPARLASKEIQA